MLRIDASRPSAPRQVAERFHVKYRVAASGCWVWVACRDKAGYGRITVKRKPQLAHRVSWEIHNGPIPDGLYVLHTCDNPPCVNPGHLFLGTNIDNVRDMCAKGRHARGSGCIGARNGNAKLTDVDVLEIRAERRAGSIYKVLAEKWGMSISNIHIIVSGKTWRHVCCE